MERFLVLNHPVSYHIHGVFGCIPYDRNPDNGEDMTIDDEIPIKVEHVSKKYSKSLKRSMLYGIKDIGSNMLGLSSHSEKLRKSEFWAVDDVSFTVKKGETFGIIGPNGSGKTTLLKMLNGIFWPDKGKITVRGRVGALIAVGAGFHPLLTGRENVYINAAIMGMDKEEVDKKFENIIKFADIGDFIDVPVKYYSSGMFVRLGFAVAIHCEPDVLLVDEVLSVGDSSFRSKCYQKINELKKKGVAIILVSHNLFMVEKFCERGLFIDQGSVKSLGDIRNIIQDYQELITRLSINYKNESIMPEISSGNKKAIITKVRFLDHNGNEKKEFAFGETFGIRVEYKTNHSIDNPQIEISIFNKKGIKICSLDTMVDDVQTVPPIGGKGKIETFLESLPLLADIYYINVHLYDSHHTSLYDYWSGMFKTDLSFKVLPNQISATMGDYMGICHFHAKWIKT